MLLVTLYSINGEHCQQLNNGSDQQEIAADHCHCLTVDSATGVIGNIIFNQWRDGSFWCGSNITQLCASNSTFYSVLISQNGSLLRDDALLCDNSTDEATISESYYMYLH